MSYWDTSCLIKLYTPEPDFGRFRSHLAAARGAGETEIVASDKRLREAALALGFTVFPPP